MDYRAATESKQVGAQLKRRLATALRVVIFCLGRSGRFHGSSHGGEKPHEWGFVALNVLADPP
jgi:hypothetical protein